MPTTILRKVGGSVMLRLPSALLDLLDLRAGTTVNVVVEGGRLVIEPQRRPHYRLDELLAQCDASAEIGAEDREWLDDEPIGSELL